jgi:uncharacterized protein YodC (DUF2158 family)
MNHSLTPPSTAPADQIATGTLVRLRSGGPLMTVLGDGSVGSERKVHCGWVDGGGHYHDIRVPREAVERIG